MKTYTVHYRFEGAQKVEAETEAEALRKFQQIEDIDLARNVLDSLTVEWVETEPKTSEMVRI